MSRFSRIHFFVIVRVLNMTGNTHAGTVSGTVRVKRQATATVHLDGNKILQRVAQCLQPHNGNYIDLYFHYIFMTFLWLSRSAGACWQRWTSHIVLDPVSHISFELRELWPGDHFVMWVIGQMAYWDPARVVGWVPACSTWYMTSC